MELKSAVLSQLSKGKENAITGKDLAHRLGQRDTRQIRLAIDELIQDGNVICSTPHQPYGYFIAATREEVNEAMRRLKYGYGRKIYRHYKCLEASRNKLFPQLGLKI